MPQYKVHGTWMMSGYIIVEAENEERAQDCAADKPLDEFKDVEFVEDSYVEGKAELISEN